MYLTNENFIFEIATKEKFHGMSSCHEMKWPRRHSPMMLLPSYEWWYHSLANRLILKLIEITVCHVPIRIRSYCYRTTVIKKQTLFLNLKLHITHQHVDCEVIVGAGYALIGYIDTTSYALR